MPPSSSPFLSFATPAPKWQPGSRLLAFFSFLLAPRDDLIVVLHMWSSAGTFTLAFHMFYALKFPVL